MGGRGQKGWPWPPPQSPTWPQSDITAAFVSTPAEHQLACRRLLLESRVLCAKAEQQPCFASWLVVHATCQTVRKQDGVVVSDNAHKLSHTARSTVPLALHQAMYLAYSLFLPFMYHAALSCLYYSISVSPVCLGEQLYRLKGDQYQIWLDVLRRNIWNIMLFKKMCLEIQFCTSVLKAGWFNSF